MTTRPKATRSVRSRKTEPQPPLTERLPKPRPERRDDPDTLEFLQAIDTFKRRTGRAFPNWSEVLDILLELGYRKVEPGRNGHDRSS